MLQAKHRGLGNYLSSLSLDFIETQEVALMESLSVHFFLI